MIGGICLLLAFYALGTLPLNFAALALIVFGLVLFALEPFLTAHGILAVGGALAFGIGSLLLVNAPESGSFLRISPLAVAAVTGFFLVLFLVLVATVVRSRSRKAVTGPEGMIGAIGVVRRELRPGHTGMVFVEGEQWRALSSDGPIPVGERVVVQALDGLTLTVQRAPQVIPGAPRSIMDAPWSRQPGEATA